MEDLNYLETIKGLFTKLNSLLVVDSFHSLEVEYRLFVGEDCKVTLIDRVNLGEDSIKEVYNTLMETRAKQLTNKILELKGGFIYEVKANFVDSGNDLQVTLYKGASLEKASEIANKAKTLNVRYLCILSWLENTLYTTNFL